MRSSIVLVCLLVSATAGAAEKMADQVFQGSSPSAAGQVACSIGADNASWESAAACGVAGTDSILWRDAGSDSSGSQIDAISDRINVTESVASAPDFEEDGAVQCTSANGYGFVQHLYTPPLTCPDDVSQNCAAQTCYYTDGGALTSGFWTYDVCLCTSPANPYLSNCPALPDAGYGGTLLPDGGFVWPPETDYALFTQWANDGTGTTTAQLVTSEGPLDFWSNWDWVDGPQVTIYAPTDGGSPRMGVNTLDPDANLEVVGTAHVTGLVTASAGAEVSTRLGAAYVEASVIDGGVIYTSEIDSPHSSAPLVVKLDNFDDGSGPYMRIKLAYNADFNPTILEIDNALGQPELLLTDFGSLEVSGLSTGVLFASGSSVLHAVTATTVTASGMVTASAGATVTGRLGASYVNAGAIDGGAILANGAVTSTSTVQGSALQLSASLLAPVVTATGSGATTNQQGIETGATALVAGTGSVIFSPPYTTSAPICTCTDRTAAAAVKCSATTSTLTLAGTSTDTIAWICIGRK